WQVVVYFSKMIVMHFNIYTKPDSDIFLRKPKLIETHQARGMLIYGFGDGFVTTFPVTIFSCVAHFVIVVVNNKMQLPYYFLLNNSCIICNMSWVFRLCLGHFVIKHIFVNREATNAMKESRVQDILVSLSALQYRRMDLHEFCAAVVSVHQLEALDRWEQHARSAYEYFEKEVNRAIVIDELASFGGPSSIPDILFIIHVMEYFIINKCMFTPAKESWNCAIFKYRNISIKNHINFLQESTLVYPSPGTCMPSVLDAYGILRLHSFHASSNDADGPISLSLNC
ncbi:hypothetical protein ACJX0J_017485, partial [Zea mays]